MNNYKILLVDDMVENLRATTAIFREYRPEYKLYQTNQPENALNIALVEQPDLIITDWDMPEVDGLVLIRQLKNNPATRDIPVIMATGVMLTSEDLKRALEAGATDYLRKPIDAVELLARTHSVLLISEYYKQSLEAKNNELSESALNLVRVNEVIDEVAKKLRTAIGRIPNEHSDKLQELDETLSQLLDENQKEAWQRFNVSFQTTHKDFYANLIAKHSNITPAELKLCALLKLGLSSKDIASILFMTPESVKVSRSRLRKKLDIGSSQNLINYLAQF